MPPVGHVSPRVIGHGHVSAPRVELVDDHRGNVSSVIRRDTERFGPEALADRAEFPRPEVALPSHRVPAEAVEAGAHHPRGNPDRPPVGFFTRRAENRPNRPAASRCSLERMDATNIRGRDLDAVDGTPVLDIKPYMREFGPHGELHNHPRRRSPEPGPGPRP